MVYERVAFLIKEMILITVGIGIVFRAQNMISVHTVWDDYKMNKFQSKH